jgi:hypothetical protein
MKTRNLTCVALLGLAITCCVAGDDPKPTGPEKTNTSQSMFSCVSPPGYLQVCEKIDCSGGQVTWGAYFMQSCYLRGISPDGSYVWGFYQVANGGVGGQNGYGWTWDLVCYSNGYAAEAWCTE